MPPESLPARIYEFVTEADDDRACAQLPDGACEEAPRSFLLNVSSGGVTKLAEQLASPEVVLPWLLSAMGAPLGLVGLLTPVRQSGSLLPQMVVSGAIRGFAVRKWFWVGAGAVQALCVAGMALVALGLNDGAGEAAAAAGGWAIVALLAVFSVASGVQSISFKDVIAKTIPKGKRGRVLAMRAMLGGVLTLGAGAVIRVALDDEADPRLFVWPLGVAAALWMLGVLLFAMINERPGHADGGRSAIKEVGAGMRLLIAKPGFRRFIIARSLLLAIPLATPFYIVLFREKLGAGLGSLGVFVIVTGVAGVVASPVLGKFADASSRFVMVAAGAVGALAAAMALGAGALPEAWVNAPVLSLVLMVNAFAYAAARLGRKTYLVDGAPDDDRPLYTASANTAISLLTVAGAGLGALGDVVGLTWLIALILALCALAAVAAWIMPEAERMAA